MSEHRMQPGPGQESVWDYPRPPRLENFAGHIQVHFNGEMIADTQQARRVLETSHPQVYYIPPADIQLKFLVRCPGRSLCEWKGQACYYTVIVGNRKAEKAAWYYPDPTGPFFEIQNYVAFYPVFMDACFIDGEKVVPQPGDFYGGWITSNIAGPFKGEPGTMD